MIPCKKKHSYSSLTLSGTCSESISGKKNRSPKKNWTHHFPSDLSPTLDLSQWAPRICPVLVSVHVGPWGPWGPGGHPDALQRWAALGRRPAGRSDDPGWSECAEGWKHRCRCHVGPSAPWAVAMGKWGATGEMKALRLMNLLRSARSEVPCQCYFARKQLS